MGPITRKRQDAQRAAWLSQTIRERRRFIAREVSPWEFVSRYHLREEDAVVLLRHQRGTGNSDPWVLYEVLRGGDYHLPPAVSARLETLKKIRIVDLGANLGFFSIAMLARYPQAALTAFEPDNQNLALLRQALEANGLQSRVDLIEACAHTENGTLEFVGGQGCMSHVSFGEESLPTSSVPARDVFPFLSQVDLLKMDIEGAEWKLLADERFAEARPRAMVLEYHSIECPGDNPKQEATARLTELGYEVHHPQPDLLPDQGPAWGAAVLWAYLP